MISSLPPSGSAKARLERRSQAVARLRHPNLVRMLPLPGGAGLSPVLGDARRLADFTLPAGTFKRFELEQVVRLLLDVLSGVSALHEVVTDGEPFVHGEISPQHVYIDEHGTARLVPLLTSHLTGSSRLELSGYVAPERLAGEPTDGRADVFSVGVMLWEALAGTRLFPKVELTLVRARLAEPLQPKLSPRDRWAEPLSAIARRAISDDPSERFQTALDFSHALATAAAQQLSRVDTDAWQEEAPTPVLQPRLHLHAFRPTSTPPPLPSVQPEGPETAPPTVSEEGSVSPPRAGRGRRAGTLLATLAVLAAAAAWVVAYRLPPAWQKLLVTADVTGETLSMRARAAAAPAPVVQPVPQPLQAEPSPVAPRASSAVASPAPSAATTLKAPASASARVGLPKAQDRSRDYGI